MAEASAPGLAAHDSPAPGSEEAVEEEEEEDDAPDPEVLAANGREIARGTGYAVYFYKEQVIAHIAKPMKKLPAFSVAVRSPKCRSTNAWQRVEYAVSLKSKVQVNGETTTVKALGPSIEHVWGYEAPDCEKRREAPGGDVKPLFWAPPREDLATCDALLDPRRQLQCMTPPDNHPR